MAVSAMAAPATGWSKKSMKAEPIRHGVTKKIRDTKVKPAQLKAPLKADGQLQMDWGYCDEPYNAFQLDTYTVNQAIKVSADATEQLAGASVNSVLVGTPANPEIFDEDAWEYGNDIESVTVWLAYDLNGEHFAEATGKFEKVGFTWSSVPLSTPYIIEKGKPFYVGVTYEMNVYEVDGEKVSDDCGFVTDYSEPEYANTNLVYTAIRGLDENYEFVYADTPAWRNLADYFGNACIRIDVTGDNLPTDYAYITDSYLPSFVAPGDKFEVLLGIKNMGATTLETVDVCVEYSDGTKQTITSDVLGYEDYGWDLVPAPIGYNGFGILDAFFDAPAKEGYTDYTITLPTLNGKDANNAVTSIEGSLLSLSTGFHKNNVVEEGTGTWCGNCPLGYAGMQWLARNCEENAIGIALHCEDPMAVLDRGGAFEEFSQYIMGYPSAFFNRNWMEDIYPSPEDLEEQMWMVEDIPALAEIKATITPVSDDKKTIKLDTSVQFSVSDESGSFGIAYTVVEDGVGPYLQVNYMAGSDPGSAYGFEDMPEEVELIFDDVARNCSHPKAFANSLPAAVTPGSTYDFSTEIVLSDVSNLDNYRVVPMVVNTKTGFVENACVVKSPTYSYSAIKSIQADKMKTMSVRGGKGVITISGATDNVRIYTLDGRFVGNATGFTTHVAPGFYIVNRGTEAVKVIVK